jgi:2-oxoisovalerate dehydrogenase E2 component (dihydrolipoyl transacylase)
MTLREFRLPDLGEGLTESDIVAWRIAEGDSVELNQIIAEVETAKALVELPSPYAGVVAALHADAGQTVNVGDPLVTFAVTPAAGAPAKVDDDAPEPNLVGYGARPEHAGHPVRRARRVPQAAPVPPPTATLRADRAPAPTASSRAPTSKPPRAATPTPDR